MENKNFNNILKKDLLFYIFIAVFCSILLLIHFRIDIFWGDDMHFVQQLEEWKLFPLLKERYMKWSSRIIIEFFLIMLSAFAPDLWRVLNVVIILLLLWNVTDLFGGKDKKISFILFSSIIWLIPISSIYNAGWISTTLNYLWPLSLGLIALRPLAHNISGQKCRKWEYICCPLCLVFAANMELMCAIILGAYLLYLILFLVQKKQITFIFYTQLFLSVLSIGFILISPGNEYRKLQEIERFMPEFADMSVSSKLLMGLIENGNYYFASGYIDICYVMGALTGIMLLIFLSDIKNRKCKRFLWLQSVIILCPFIAYWSFTFLFFYLLYYMHIPKFRNVLAVLSENRFILEKSNFSMSLVLLQASIYFLVFLCLFFAVYVIHGWTQETFIQMVILGAGFCSHMVLSFSPTIYMSGARAALFCSMGILIVTFRNLVILWDKNISKLWKISWSIYFCCLLNLNLNILGIIRNIFET